MTGYLVQTGRRVILGSMVGLLVSCGGGSGGLNYVRLVRNAVP